MAKTKKNENKQQKAVVKEAAVVEETVVDTVAVVKNVEKKTLSDDDMIQVVSMYGNIGYEDSNTGYTFNWESVGDINDMSYAEIKHMMKTTPNMIRKGFVFVDSKEVYSSIRLDKMFDGLSYVINYDYKSNDSMQELTSNVKLLVQTYPTLKTNLVSYYTRLVLNGTIEVISLIRQLELALGVKDVLSNNVLR